MQQSIQRISSSMLKMGIYGGKLYMLPYGHKRQYRTSKKVTLRTHRIGK